MSCLALFPKAARDHHRIQVARAADALRFVIEAHKAPDNEARRVDWDRRYKALKALDRVSGQDHAARQFAIAP